MSREMLLPDKISGYQLAEHLFCEGGVEVLIRYARNAETDWLELKAGMCLLPEHREAGQTDKELHWNIAKAVIALMNTSGGALVIGIHDKTLNLVPLEKNDPGHYIAEKGIDGYIREFVRSKVWPNSLTWNYLDKKSQKQWELSDKQLPTDLISYHHAPYSGPDGRNGEVVVLLVKPSEKVRLVKEDKKSSVLLKRTRGEVGEAIPVYDYDEFEKYRMSREIESAFYANIRDQFDREHAAASESATIAVAIKNYYNGLVEKHRRMMAVFMSLDAEENVFSKDDADQFYRPEAIETFDDEDWLDDDDENEERENKNQEEDEDSDFEEGSDEGSLDNDDDAEERYDERTARKGDLLELLQSEHRVIVSGEPGGGKTTCLTYFTLKFAEGESEAPVLAVFIPMGQWRRGGSLSLMMARATGLDAGQIARLMEENRLRLVIDAVNECPDEFRVAAIQNIGMFLAEHPNIPAVISTRHPKELSSLQLPVFHVQPMDETHRLRYLERYLVDAEQAQKLLHQLGSMPGGETVAENPMLLRLVVEVYKESPEKRLPSGRAVLYRRSLRAWYKRENEKAEIAGTKLQWNRRQTFEMLATLAFKSRQSGYRDVPLEEISAILGGEAENQLEVLCQGPIIYCDADYVRFRHETFQEYLCAEYLVTHQNELPAWTQADYAQWGMPFAYAVELFELDEQQLPESFWLAAWSLNPWLGVALTDEGAGRRLLSPHYSGTRPMVDGRPLDIRLPAVFLRAVCGTLNGRSIKKALNGRGHSWYMREDVALRYVVFVTTTCKERWKRFENSQLLCLERLSVRQAIKLSENWLTICQPREAFQWHAPELWDGWISNASPERAIALVDARLAVQSDFTDVKKRWAANIELKECCRLVAARILQPSDVIERIHQWVSGATPETVAYMIKSGLVPRSEFEEQINKWRESATPVSAMAMIKMGLLAKDELQVQIQRWIDMATPDIACKMIESGLACPGDFKDRVPLWLRNPQYAFVRKFIRRYGADGTGKPYIDNDQIRWWTELAEVNSAIGLIRDELAKRDTFAERAALWADFSEVVNLWTMATGGLITRTTVVLRAEVDREIKSAIASHQMPSAEEKKRWLSYCNFSSLVEMINAGLVVRDDANEKINRWKEKASPEMARVLVSSNLAQRADFCHKIDQWKGFLSPNSALSLIKCRIIEEEDISALKESWRATIEPSTIDSAVQLGCLTADEANECLSIWDELSGCDTVPVTNKLVMPVRSGRVNSAAQEGTPIVPGKANAAWDGIADRYLVGCSVKGKVRNIAKFGAFVELEPGVDGLIHVSEISDKKIENAKDVFSVGDEVTARIVKVDPAKHQIALSLKAAPRSGVIYRNCDLIDPVRRQRIVAELEGVRWEMTVCRRNKHGGRLFFSHPSFPDNVALRSKSDKGVFSFGQRCQVVVCVEQGPLGFRFCASSAEPSSPKGI